MKLSKSQLVVLSFIILLMVPLAFAASYRQTTTWTMANLVINSTPSNCTSINQIGYGSSKDLGTLSFTNSSDDDAGNVDDGFDLKIMLRYGDTSSSLTNSSWDQSTSFDVSSLSASKYVGVCFNVSNINGTSAAGIDIDNLVLSYSGGGAIDDDIMEGLPQIGSDTGSFLKNLAPGVGAFIIILGIFAAIAGIIYAIVGIVQRKIAV